MHQCALEMVQAMEAAAREAMTDEERATAERAAAEAAQLATLLTQTWQEQNDWMDYYRQRLGPSEGYAQRYGLNGLHKSNSYG